MTVPAAKQVGLPHWPINCSYELAYDFFANVIHDFGKGFIMDFLRPYATEKLELNNIDTFVRDFLGEYSYDTPNYKVLQLLSQSNCCLFLKKYTSSRLRRVKDAKETRGNRKRSQTQFFIRIIQQKSQIENRNVGPYGAVLNIGKFTIE